jgi:hypothetical protein
MFALALWLLSRLSIHAIDWIGQHCGGGKNFCGRLKQARDQPPSDTFK